MSLDNVYVLLAIEENSTEGTQSLVETYATREAAKVGMTQLIKDLESDETKPRLYSGSVEDGFAQLKATDAANHYTVEILRKEVSA